jgi:hypothetical protein
MYEEAIFPIASETPNMVWLEHSTLTEIPRSIGPKRDGVCRQLPGGGCEVIKNPAVAWPSLREELRSWSRK